MIGISAIGWTDEEEHGILGANIGAFDFIEIVFRWDIIHTLPPQHRTADTDAIKENRHGRNIPRLFPITWSRTCAHRSTIPLGDRRGKLKCAQ